MPFDYMPGYTNLILLVLFLGAVGALILSMRARRKPGNITLPEPHARKPRQRKPNSKRRTK